MSAYIARRLFYAIFVLFGVATMVFFITRLTGDPVLMMLPPDADMAQIAELRTALGMDRPLVEQYWIYVTRLLRLDFGDSLRYHEPTLSLLLERLPATLELAGAALLFSLLIAVPAGIFSALKRGTVWDNMIMSVVFFGQSMPVFWFGILLILFFSVRLHWLPTGGYGDLRHLILPATALGIRLVALVTRLIRSSLIEVMGSDYIRTAYAKGLMSGKVVFKHAFRNCLLPLVTVVGLEIGWLLGGSVVTETIFAWPGVGQLLVQAIFARDFPLIQGAIITLAGLFTLINLIVDVSYVFIDPRIQY